MHVCMYVCALCYAVVCNWGGVVCIGVWVVSQGRGQATARPAADSQRAPQQLHRPRAQQIHPRRCCLRRYRTVCMYVCMCILVLIQDIYFILGICIGLLTVLADFLGAIGSGS